MRNIRWPIYITVVFLICGVASCRRVEPAPTPDPAAAAGAPPAPVSPPVPAVTPATLPSPAPSAPAVAVSHVPAWAKVDEQIQQRILAIGARHHQEQVKGDLTFEQMKQIGSALYSFHMENNDSFPAINGLVEPGFPPSGLSWRVAILPYMGEMALYQEFHLDEPWDSPHNKTLLTRMPKLYGEMPEGQTRVHVLTGNGTPFRMNEMFSAAEAFRNGPASSVLAVLGGPDTAGPWTKPTALEFDPRQPFNCLGKSDDNYLIVMMNGVTYWLSKSASPSKFSLLARVDDHQRLEESDVKDMLAEGRQPGYKSTPLQPLQITTTVTTPLAPLAPKFDLNLIPDDAFLALVGHPRHLAQNALIKAVPRQSAATILAAVFGDLSQNTQGTVYKLIGYSEGLGVAAESLDEITLVIDKSWPAAVVASPIAPIPLGVVLKSSTPFNVEAILTQLATVEAQNWAPRGIAIERVSIKEHEGVGMMVTANSSFQIPIEIWPAADEYHLESLTQALPDRSIPPTPGVRSVPAQTIEVPAPAGAPPDVILSDGRALVFRRRAIKPLPPPDQIVVALLSDSVMLVGTESVVRKMISARATSAATTPLKKTLELAGNRSLVLAVDTQLVEQAIPGLLKQAPPAVGLLTSQLPAAQTLSFVWDNDTPEMFKLDVKYQSSELAKQVSGIAQAAYKTLREQYTSQRQQLTQDSSSASLLPYLDQLTGESKIFQTGESVSVVIPQFRNVDGLATALQGTITTVTQAAATNIRLKELKEIGDGALQYFLNDRPKTGLSWRVHILPYLNEYELYTRFNLKQPWNSPQNKALINEMPKIFGSNPEGKTQVHIFAGPGAPFEKNKRGNFADIKDGPSRTIMIIEAGEEASDVWTKPGGLKFDPANPLKCLGAAKEFQVVMFDSKPQILKNLTNEVLLKLIQHADGKASKPSMKNTVKKPKG